MGGWGCRWWGLAVGGGGAYTLDPKGVEIELIPKCSLEAISWFG